MPPLGRLLIVDDEVELMTVLCETLIAQGYEADGYTSGVNALAALQTGNYDVLLADMMMPAMDGITLLRSSMEIDPQLVGIIMTGQGTVQTAVEAMQLGAFDYILKPFKLQALLPILARAVEMRRLRFENIQLRDTVAIYTLSQTIANTPNIEVIADKILEAALEQSEGDEASILVKAADGLQVLAVRGEGRQGLVGQHVPFEPTISGWVASHQEPVVLQGQVTDPRFAPLFPREDIHSSVSVPMLVAGKLVGVLNVNTLRARPFTPGEVKALTILANTGAAALEQSTLFRALRESEERFKVALDESPISVFNQDLDLRFTWMYNPGVGYHSSEIIGFKDEDILTTESAERLQVLKQAVLQSGQGARHEVKIASKRDGRVMYIDLTIEPLRDAAGAVIGITCAALDITQSKQSDQARRESEERFQLVARATNDAIWDWDITHDTIWWNDAFYKVFGYTHADLINKNEHWVNHIHPGDRKETEQGIVTAVTGGDETWTAEYRFESKDGSYRYVLDRGYVVRDSSGKPVRMLGSMMDVTASRLTEAQLRFQAQMLDTVGQAITTTDVLGNIIYWNQYAERLFGWKAAEVLGRPVLEVIPSEISLLEADNIMARIRAGENWSGEISVSRRDGSIFPALVLNSPIYDEHGMLSGVIGVATDMSDVKKAQAALRQSEERFRALIEHSTDGITLISPRGVISYASPATSLILGYSNEELLGMNSLSLIHPDEVHIAEGMVLRTVQSPGHIETGEYRTRHKNGSWRWINGSVQNLLAEPSVKAVIINFRDITERKQAETEVLARSQELALLNEIGQRLSKLLQPAQIMEELYTAIAQLFDNRNLYVALHDEIHGLITFPFYTMNGERAYAPDRPLRKALTEHILETQAPLLITHNMAETMHEMGIDVIGTPSKCYLGVPMLVGIHPIGVIAVQDYEKEYVYSAHHVDLLMTIAGQTAISLENARLLEATRRQLGELELVNRVSNSLRSAQTLEQMLPTLMDEALALFNTDSGSIMLHDAARGLVVPAVRRGWFTDLSWVSPFSSAEGIVGRVVQTGEPHIIHDFADDVYLRLSVKEQTPKGWSGAAIPIFSAEAIVGVMTVTVKLPRELNAGELQLLQTVADIAGNTIHRMQLYEQTQRRAEQLAAVNLLGQALAETLETGEIYERLYTATTQLLPDICGVIVAHYDHARRQLVSDYGRVDGDLVPREEFPVVTIRPDGVGPNTEVIKTRRPLVVNDLQARVPTMTGVVEVGSTAQPRSGLYIPMLIKGEIFGTLVVQSYTLNRFTPGEAEILSTVANTSAIALENARLFDETNRRLQYLQALRTIDNAITASLDLRVTLNVLLEQITTQLRVDAASILLLSPHSYTLNYAAGRGFRTSGITGAHLRLGEGHAGRAALERRMVVVPDMREANELASRANLFMGEDFVTYYGLPLIAKGQVKGVLDVFHRSLLSPDEEWIEFLQTLANQAAIAIDNAQLFEDLQRSNVDLSLAYDATIEGWSRALDLRDKETEGHSRRVTEMTITLAQAMGAFSEAELIHLRRGALLHDIGKMGIPDHILLKSGQLTDEEWQIMRQHPTYAYELLLPIHYLHPALDIPYCHHEKWDGTGYPRGLKGDRIPLAARIFAVVDVWDALCSDRPYRPAWPVDKVRDFIRQQSNTHFDPDVVNTFLDTIRN
jgi:PAS domain S-box-containing protein